MKHINQQQAQQLQQLYMQAQQALRSQHHDIAAAAFRRILKQVPQALEARNGLAVALASAQRFPQAAEEFRLVLKAHPHHAQTHHNLGNVLYEQELFEEALQHFQLAVKLQPELSMAQLHLAQCLRRLNRPQEAIDHYKRALDLDKRNHFAMHALGQAYQAVGDLPRTLECFEFVCGLAPEIGEYRLSFGLALKEAKFDFEAIEQLQKACDLLSDPSDAALVLVEILQRFHRHEEALDCLKKVVALSPKRVDIHERMGDIYAWLGDANNAIVSFNRSLAINSNRSEALVGIGQAALFAGDIEKTRSVADELIERHPKHSSGYLLKTQSDKIRNENWPYELHKLLNTASLSNEEVIAIEFALGKSYDDLSKPQQAFAHFLRGNHLKSAQLDYNETQEAEFFQATQDYFNTDFFDSHNDWGVKTSQPVFIIGMPRSGTTLTEQIISSHSEVFGAGEVTYWGHVMRNLPARIRATRAYPYCLEELQPVDAKELAQQYLTTLNKIAGADANPKHITDKFPHNFLRVGWLCSLFPNARIIHVKRNKMDNCLSIFFQNFSEEHAYSYNLKSIANHYCHYERLMTHWHKVLPGRIFDVQYEDLIADPEALSKKLIAHVGLEWDDACLAPHKLERSVKTASHWQVRQPIYKTSIEKWRAYEPFLDDLKNWLGLS